MSRALPVLLAVTVLSLPGCATRKGRAAAFTLSAIATFAGAVMLHDVTQHPTECEEPMEDGTGGDFLCLGSIAADAGRAMPPALLLSSGAVLMIASGISIYMHRHDPAPGRTDPVRRGNLRYKRWDDDASRASGPR